MITGEKSGYVLTLCGRYSVSKDCVMGKEMYTAWRCRIGDTPEHMIGIRDDRKQAKRLCELDRK